MFFCEEDQIEINRKFSAITYDWSDVERLDAINNLLLVPLIGKDARLTAINRGQYLGSGTATELIKLLISLNTAVSYYYQVPYYL
jgi:hypothetical protein